MSDERFAKLMADDESKLTPEEIAAGWHFCWEWDGLLYGPDMKMPCGCGIYVPSEKPKEHAQ